MKKILVMVLLALGTTVFAQEVSELYQEFERRNSIVFTKNQGQALDFLSNLEFAIENIEKFEFFNPENVKQFVIQTKSGDVCFADMNMDLLRCKNAAGITTINYAGDAD